MQPTTPDLDIPASPAQHGVWVTERAGAAGAAYRMPLTLTFHGPLDAPAMRAACADVLARHPLLGAAVAERDGEPWLVPAPVPPAVTAEDLTGLDDDKRAAAVRAHAERDLDLARGPLAGFALLALGPDRHVLVFTAHHLVFDGISKDVLVADLAACYRARLGGAAPDLPALPALAGQERAAAAGEEAAAFWRSRWPAPAGPVLPGPARAPHRGAAGQEIELTLPGLASAATGIGVTTFEFLLAALHALLRRYGNERAVVAVDLSTRTPADRGSVGLFVNELPVVTRPDPEAPFAAFAAEVRRELREVYRFRGVPLAQVAGGMAPATSLAPISLSHRERDGAVPDFPGLATEVDWSVFNGAPRGVLHLHTTGTAGDVTVRLRFAPEAVAPRTVRAVAGHLRTLAAAAAAAPDTPLGDLPLLTAAEERDLAAVNATARAVPDLTVPQLFAERARQAPDAVAVAFQDRELTYAELDAASARLAGTLRARGAGPGTLVAIHLDRSPEMVAAVLGVLRAGAAYLPLDPAYPAERLAFVLRDAGAALVLAPERGPEPPCVTGAAEPPDTGAEVLRLGPLAGWPAPPSPLDATPPAPGDLAYVIYTSGSTGRPKGVAVEHRPLTNLLLAMRDELGAAEGDAWLGLTTLSFDISALELMLPLITGGRVVLVPEGVTRDGRALRRLVETGSISHVQATPSSWRLLTEAGLDRPGLVALSGGEPLPPALAGDLRARVGRLVNVYGPTETTIWSAIDEVPPGPAEITIGRPLANTRIHILDERLVTVPAGVPGEICIGGAGVARGYLDRPEPTAARFVPDPAGPPGARLYRTGDLGRRRPDGRIEFLGRADGQVKIRGHRIELGEIEARLLEHELVAAAAVAVRDGERLVAYVVPRTAAAPGTSPGAASAAVPGLTAPGAGPGGASAAVLEVASAAVPGAAPRVLAETEVPGLAGRLREHLARGLPGVMVPAAYVALDRLPLTPARKLDRLALPEPPARATEPAPAAVPAAADPLISEITAIWEEVLKIDGIRPDEDLFDLGGHSLSITRIASRIRGRLGVDVDLDVFFDTPTIDGVAEAVRSAREESA
ncbi:hypothetical protein Sru01_34890 [Sphaerisporangium rufum]|uniref:Carrier domain-containing protein n=1 Tax=Sphaerisporangium rufum TaxID=1381558 RepID=A0A919V1E5_9ACTN|nr:non-ribosomal peptide synthetase [Sphaerisporangium rufum]GII78507.1 hypothetical protein Sru01_34890 [Sphaerisporangium rufum]